MIDVHLPGGEGLDRFLLLGVAAKAAEHVDAHGKGREAGAERLVMLKRQDRGGSEHGHLFAVGESFERRAHGHFGLAVADVAAQQPVHRQIRFEVAFDIGDGLGLIRSFFKFEASSNSRCQSESGGKAWPPAALRSA